MWQLRKYNTLNFIDVTQDKVNLKSLKAIPLIVVMGTMGPLAQGFPFVKATW